MQNRLIFIPFILLGFKANAGAVDVVLHSSCEVGRLNILSLGPTNPNPILRKLVNQGYNLAPLDIISDNQLARTSTQGHISRLEINLGQEQYEDAPPPRESWRSEGYYRRQERWGSHRIRKLQVIEHRPNMFPMTHVNEHREVNERFSPNNKRQNARAIEWALDHLPPCRIAVPRA